MGRDGTGEVVTGEIEVLEALTELEGFRERTGEGHGGELEADEAVLFLVPAGNADELLAYEGDGGVGEDP